MRNPGLAISLIVALSSQGFALDVIWNDAHGIHRLRAGDPTAMDLFQTFETRGVAVDLATDRIFWSDVLPLGGPLPGGVIRSANIHGGEIIDIVGHLRAPAGIALDLSSDTVYWTDLGDASETSAIYRADTDGSDVQKLVAADWLSEIQGISVDTNSQHIYFTYINPLIDGLFNGGIARADLDGSNVESVISGLAKPNGLALDIARETVFWADEGLGGPNQGTIQAARFDGNERRTLLSGLDRPTGIALDPAAIDVFWVDEAAGEIQRSPASGDLPLVEVIYRDLDGPTAIAVVPEPAGVRLLGAGALAVVWSALPRRRPRNKGCQRLTVPVPVESVPVESPVCH